MKTISTALFAFLFLVGIEGFSQVQNRQAVFPGLVSPPKSISSARPVANFMSTQMAGPYQVRCRTSNFDRTSSDWLPDSVWTQEEYDIVPVSGITVPKLLRYVGFYYEYPDDSVKTEYFTDGGFTNRDTLVLYQNKTGGTWITTSRYRTRYTSYGQVESADYQNGSGQLVPFSQMRRRAVKDSLGREIAHYDSLYIYPTSAWRVNSDSVWYYGSTNQKAQVRAYSPGSNGQPCMAIRQDSIRTSASGEFEYMVTFGYREDGAVLAFQRESRSYRGDTLVISNDRTSYPGGPQQRQTGWRRQGP